MHGGVILFRGAGADARRYVEADRSRADDYYLGSDATVAAFTAVDGDGTVTAKLGLDPEAYAGWVDWVNPLTGESMGRPRLPGEGRQGSPRFAEMVVNAPKSLSIAAALHPEVSAALDLAQQDAVAEIQRWLAQHSVTRVGPRGKQEVVPVEALQTTRGAHQRLTSEWGEPPRSNESADAWVERVTRPRIENDPRVSETEEEHRAARDALLNRPERAQAVRLAAYARAFGAETVSRNAQAYLGTNPARQAASAEQTAKRARKEAELLRSLTPDEAVARIKQTRAEEAARDAPRAEQERARLHDFGQQRRSTPRRDGPTRGL